MSILNLKKPKTLGSGQMIQNGGIADKEVLSKLMGYRKSVVAGYRSLLVEDIGSNITFGEMYVSPKIDGELWFLIIDNGEAVLSNTSGKVIFGDIPLIDEVKAQMNQFQGQSIFAGELYVATKDTRPRVSDLASALGGGPKAEVNKLGFAVFDVLHGGDSKSVMPLAEYAERLEMIQRIFEKGKRVKCVKTEVANTPEDAKGFYDSWVEEGNAEGLIIRQNNGRIYKVKPSFTVDTVIIGYTEKNDDETQVRSVILALMRNDNTFQLLGSCGNLGDTKSRKEMLEKIKPLQASSSWRFTSGDGAMYRFVKPEVIVEVKMSDVQSEDSSGDLIRKMVLDFKSEWTALQKLPLASIIYPVFVRYREDKSINPTDLRLEQISDRCLVSDAKVSAEAIELPESEIIRREVYTKESKGLLAVRKLVLWKTNKDQLDSNYAPYVVHWTDYSPSRKDPLKKEVRLASNQKSAEEIADQMIESNIKKGWEKN